MSDNTNNSNVLSEDEEMNPGSFKTVAKLITTNHWFELAITLVIIINSFLIGVETYHTHTYISIIQAVILYIFSAEILLRFIASPSVKAFFTDGWNIFDLILVIVGYIPESMVDNASALLALRVLRIFRVLRLLRAAKEIKVIVNVLLKSTTAMFYNVVLFGIFIYLFSIIGVGLFKLPDPDTLTGESRQRYEQLMEIAPHSPSNSPDPFGTLGEAMFTLFRELTGEDWTDLRYNHVTAYELGVIKTPPVVINAFHIMWFVISAFLLLNLVTGAIINNYQSVMDKTEHGKEEKKLHASEVEA